MVRLSIEAQILRSRTFISAGTESCASVEQNSRVIFSGLIHVTDIRKRLARSRVQLGCVHRAPDRLLDRCSKTRPQCGNPIGARERTKVTVERMIFLNDKDKVLDWNASRSLPLSPSPRPHTHFPLRTICSCT